MQLLKQHTAIKRSFFLPAFSVTCRPVFFLNIFFFIHLRLHFDLAVRSSHVRYSTISSNVPVVKTLPRQEA